MAEALDYGLDHWPRFTVFLDDGRVELDSNRVENLIRPQAGVDSLCPSSSSVWEH